MTESPILWFDKIGIHDIASVGGKNASLGEMVRTLSAKGVRVPDGFATSADAYRSFIAANGIEAAL
jgi:pyruvate,water dikinase